MKKEMLSHALNMLDDDIIEETYKVRQQKKFKRQNWIKFAAAAACVCLAATGVLLFKKPSPAVYKKGEITLTADGVTIPNPEISLSSNAAQTADMLGFFIYQGRLYMQNEWLNDNGAIAGEYLGTVTGLIDEWTPKDGYVDLAGSISGDFYSVNGFDPSFMLCMKHDDGQISTYICATGITLKYGSELFEDRLHLSENYTAAEYESYESWMNSKGEIYKLGSDATDTINNFIKDLNSAEFIPGDKIIPENEELYRVYLKMKNGMTMTLRLFDGGYVCPWGIDNVCLKTPQNEFNSLLSLFKKR